MNPKDQMADLPRAIRENLERNRADYEGLIRKTRWRDRPLYLLAGGPTYAAGVGGRYAFEQLLGWPALVREPRDFAAYSLSMVRPGDIVLPITLGEVSPGLLETLHAIKKRGGRVLALTDRSGGPLEGLADGIFTVLTAREHDLSPPSLPARICFQVAIRQIAVLAARLLRPPRPEYDVLDRELAELPRRLEWMFLQLRDGAKALAAAWTADGELLTVGEGFYRSVAIDAAAMVQALASVASRYVASNGDQTPPASGRRTTALFLSGSACRMKKRIHERAAELRIGGAKLLAVTDSNDRALIERSELAVLLPPQSEMTGSVLALAYVAWAAAGFSRGQLGRPAAETPKPEVHGVTTTPKP